MSPLGGDTSLGFLPENMDFSPPTSLSFAFLYFVFSTPIIYLLTYLFFLLLTEVSVSYFDSFSSFLPPHFLIFTGICQTLQQWLKYAKWYFLISIYQLWSRNLPPLTEAFLCRHMFGFNSWWMGYHSGGNVPNLGSASKIFSYCS